MTKVAAIILAAGSGERAQAGDTALPKQYRCVGGRAVLHRTLCAFEQANSLEFILTVIRAADRERYDSLAAGFGNRLLSPVTGGTTRQASVMKGLEALEELAPDHVLIHDAARPFASPALLQRVNGALIGHKAVVPVLPVTDTLKRKHSDGALHTVARDGLWAAQTPQGFHFRVILAAHKAASSEGRFDFTDDAAIAEWHGIPVHMVEGEAGNVKLTTGEDIAIADRLLSNADVRIGQGFDVHAFAPGDHVVLCGVKIPHEKSLSGHSDADVAMHALTDALLGAIGDGDIGTHFPPSDPQWRGAASDIFLRDAAARVRGAGGEIVNLDVTIICEAPKIGPHREAMRSSLADILELDSERISIKATTTEGLGFTGRREGIAAQASVSVRLGHGSSGR